MTSHHVGVDKEYGNGIDLSGTLPCLLSGGTEENLGYDSQCPDRDFNQVPSK